MNNIEIFKYSINHPEIFLDKNYMFVDKHEDLQIYVRKTRQIKNKLIAIKEVLSKKSSEKVLAQLFTDLQKLLNKYTNFSEFISFVNACDSRLEEVKNSPDLLKRITYLYLKYRDVNDVVPSEWIQALIDKSTSRKKGHAGENKLINILEGRGYKFVKTMKDFKKFRKSTAKFANQGDFSNKNLAKILNIKIGNKTQNKKLDLIIKNKYGVYFLEAKHLNTGGGGQNKQIKELIDVVKSKSNRYHFVAFLDGLHSNTILNVAQSKFKVAPKVKSQFRDMVRALKINKNNYWVNTAGFKMLF